MSDPTKPPPLAFIAVVILLAALCWLCLGCANIPVRRTYSISAGYGEAKGTLSVTLEPWDTLRHDGKTIKAPLQK